MSTATVISSLANVVKEAAKVIGSFTGSAGEASVTKKITDAVEVVAAAAPLFTSFARGQEVTAEDVRESFAAMDESRDAFDAEIARQGG